MDNPLDIEARHDCPSSAPCVSLITEAQGAVCPERQCEILPCHIEISDSFRQYNVQMIHRAYQDHHFNSLACQIGATLNFASATSSAVSRGL